MYTAKGYQSKDDLVNRYAPLVKRVAYHLIGRLPASVLVEDLIQAGMLGLLDAAGHYDETQGASFETYATIRIRGSMLDELRRNDWAPKSVHRKARQLAEAIQSVEAATGRDAQDHEVAKAMGLSLEEYHHILLETSSCRMVSFEDTTGTGSTPAADRLPDRGHTPPELLDEQRFRDSLAKAIAGLPERERLVMTLYYDRELNLKEIGAVLNVSESRISQILSQAHGRLRARLVDFRFD